jgi:hypothetical protein
MKTPPLESRGGVDRFLHGFFKGKRYALSFNRTAIKTWL